MSPLIPDAVALSFDPLFDLWMLVPLGLFAAMICIFGIWRNTRGMAWRLASFAVLFLLLLNPSIIAENREPRPDVTVIAVDESLSHDVGGRAEVAEASLEKMREQLSRYKDMDVRIVRFLGGEVNADGSEANRGTRLFAALRSALADIPKRRLAGVIALTDGQIHDAESAAEDGDLPGPFHTLLTGKKDEVDRRLVVERAPSFGMVDKPLKITIQVIDESLTAGEPVEVVVRVDGREDIVRPMEANKDQEIEVTLDHGGQTIIEIEAVPGPNELTDVNNRAVVTVNGVRDRLKVLLVSGEPHAGERTWRDILKSDPSVDLVHFTILRPPEKHDGTPTRELSLIAFPVRELFELKLDEFDLVIFDRYRRRGVLPRLYLNNIVKYVRNGGALLEASGPAFAGRLSLSRSPLGEILPGKPTGNIITQPFRAQITEAGFRHPVTSDLMAQARDGEAQVPTWGRWFRQIETEKVSGHSIMEANEGRPILVLDRVGEGRIAHLLSDQIWLWRRGFDGGGPQAELLRRTSHWLMKEPELEENNLSAKVQNSQIRIERRAIDGHFNPITVIGPDGQEQRADLIDQGSGKATAIVDATLPGLYEITDGELTTLAAVGALNPLELSDIRTTDALLKPISQATGGGVFWIDGDGLPSLRHRSDGRAMSGSDWLGLRRNGDYVVKGVRTIPLAPPLLALLFSLGLLVWAWREEGR